MLSYWDMLFVTSRQRSRALVKDFSEWLRPPPSLERGAEDWGFEHDEIRLGSRVPLAVICMLSPDVVRMKGEECLVGDIRDARLSSRCIVKSN